MADISEHKRAWEEDSLQRVLRRYPERQDAFETPSGIEVERLYTPEDAGVDYLADLGFPGEYPYTRGIQPTMYRGRFWTMRQYAGYASAEESNKRYRYLLEQGQTGLSVAFDLPTQLGYDADHPLAEGEVGKVGVSISSLEDMETLFSEIPLAEVSTSMTINSPAAVLLAMYVAVAKKQGADLGRLRGTIQNDILKEYVARGTYIFPPRPSMRLVTDTFSYCKDHLKSWNTISISGYHIREAGSTAVQEVAFTLANAIAYVQAARETGQDVDEFGGQLSFFFSAHNNLIEEIAKFRAARRLWARIMRERFGAENPRSWQLRFHTQTAGSTLTAQQPQNNIVRVTLQALAAVLGGTQSLHTNSLDEALALPSEEAVRIALRTQQIIAHESGVPDSIDPLAGSYWVEAMTNQIEARASAYLDRIDEMGGALRAIELGYVQREIQDSAYRYQREIERRERQVVGVNAYTIEEGQRPETLRLDAQVQQAQVQRLASLRARRDASQVSACLAELAQVASGDGNLMEPITACVESYATLGEICEALRQVYGEYQEATTV